MTNSLLLIALILIKKPDQDEKQKLIAKILFNSLHVYLHIFKYTSGTHILLHQFYIIPNSN